MSRTHQSLSYARSLALLAGGSSLAAYAAFPIPMIPKQTALVCAIGTTDSNGMAFGGTCISNTITTGSGSACDTGYFDNNGNTTGGLCAPVLASCNAIIQAHPSATSAVYRIDSDGDAVGNSAFDAYCEMSTDGGGWTRIYLISSLGGPYTPTTNPYNESLASQFNAGYSRIAYRITLNSTYAWTSMNDIAAGDLQKIGVPNTYSYDANASSLNVITNAANVTTQTGATAKLEFWNNCYESGLNGIYDYDDTPVSANCYGSWQVHDMTNNTTVWAWNYWVGSYTGEGGIGNNSGNTHTDWTFMYNAANYSTRRMEIFVK